MKFNILLDILIMRKWCKSKAQFWPKFNVNGIKTVHWRSNFLKELVSHEIFLRKIYFISLQFMAEVKKLIIILIIVIWGETLVELKVYVLFWHKWTISAPGIIINNPESTLMRTYIKLVTKQIWIFDCLLQSLRFLLCPCAQTGHFSSRVGTGMLFTPFTQINLSITEKTNLIDVNNRK